MGNLLIISADPLAVERLTALAQPFGQRVRSVAAAQKARGLLDVQEFDIVLVDSRYSERTALELVQLAWQKNSYAVGAIFNLYEDVAAQWGAIAKGIALFCGAAAESGLQQFFRALSAARPKRDDYAVLVVEDLDSPRDIICSYIEALGYPAVRGVSGAEEALQRLRAAPDGYFAVVTDIQMPQLSGVELLRRIRGEEMLQALPVVVLTAYATGENLLQCIKAGATGFVVKPPDKKTLRAELEKAKRIFVGRLSPRLCRAEDAHLLEQALRL